MSDYSAREWLVKNKAANAPITVEEIVMVMISIGKQHDFVCKVV